MKKNITLALVLSLLVAAVPIIAAAQGPTGTYASGISCVNLETSQATIHIEFYDTTGASAASIDDTIAAQGNVMYYTPSLTQLPDGFLGSAVVSSDVPVACSVNTQTSTGTTRVGTSNGVSGDEAGPSLYAPQVLNNLGGFTSYVAVQNTSADPVNVTATFFDSSGTQQDQQTVSVPGFSTHVFYQDDGGLPTGFLGSATVEAADGTTPLAGTVNYYNAGTGTADAQFLSYNTFTAGASQVYGPRVVKNLSNAGYTSGWSCQNIGPGTADITANVTILNQVTNSQVSDTLTSPTLDEGQAWAVYMGNQLASVERGYGSVLMESTGGDIVCIFNEDVRVGFANAGQGSTYMGIPAGSGVTDTIFFPQIVALGASSFQGGFQIANTTSNATTCTYSYSDGTTINDVPLAAGGSNSVFAPSHVSSFNGSAVVTCGQPIVGIYNLTVFGGAGDPFATNNGINQ